MQQMVSLSAAAMMIERMVWERGLSRVWFGAEKVLECLLEMCSCSRVVRKSMSRIFDGEDELEEKTLSKVAV